MLVFDKNRYSILVLECCWLISFRCRSRFAFALALLLFLFLLKFTLFFSLFCIARSIVEQNWFNIINRKRVLEVNKSIAIARESDDRGWLFCFYFYRRFLY